MSKPRPLPVINSGASADRWRPGRWRAAVLIAVHLLVAIHVAHWLASGRTMTPLEPSEAMAYGARGAVNAGLIFFVLTVLSTAVLGRWFCGWGCHMVALQDLSRWILLRLKIRPRPLRSRVLLWVPLVACAYMFGAPLLERWWSGGGLGPKELELTTAQFWDTFPTWPVAALTFLTCGALSVLFLGSKGFCTYGCPYGALYGLVDRLAPGRIRVNSDCNACGRCTKACSSNVQVSREVHDYGMVVDPGCMKCLDCVSACPTNALSYSFGRPALFATPRVDQPLTAKPAFTWGEEALLALTCAVTFFAFRGLYGQIPFLLALGLAGCSSWAALLGLRLTRRESVKLLRWHLKLRGRVRPLGYVFAAWLFALVALTGHSGFVQAHAWRAASLQAQTASIRASWQAQLLDPADLTDERRVLLNDALSHALAVDRWSLVHEPRNDLRLAWLHLLGGDDAKAEARILAVLAALPDAGAVHYDYAEFLAAAERPDEAIAAYRRARELGMKPLESGRAELRLLAKAERHADTLALARELLADASDDAEVLRLAGLAALFTQDYDQARRHLKSALARERHHESLVAMAWLLRSSGNEEGATELLDEARRLKPQ
ncbi:4Fe-4S binding protein [Planctomycetota bacterium]|nr:4Fe-4S binding protein [Planctomycetota bacterium]